MEIVITVFAVIVAAAIIGKINRAMQNARLRRTLLAEREEIRQKWVESRDVCDRLLNDVVRLERKAPASTDTSVIAKMQRDNIRAARSRWSTANDRVNYYKGLLASYDAELNNI